MNNLHMIDISDPTDPQLVAEFPYPEVPENYPWPNFNTAGMDGAQGPFGPHNIHEPMSNKPWLDQNPNRVYCCYFHAGMRVYDVSGPYYIMSWPTSSPQTGKAALRHPGARPCCWLPRGLRGGRPRLHLHGYLARRHVYPAHERRHLNHIADRKK